MIQNCEDRNNRQDIEIEKVADRKLKSEKTYDSYRPSEPGQDSSDAVREGACHSTDDELKPIPPIRRREERIRKQKIKENLYVVKEWGLYIGLAFVIALIIIQFIKPTIVKQNSMEPNFHTNDYLFISKQSYRLFGGKPKMGDVIVFRSKLTDKNGKNKLLIKRVIGVPGDVVTIKDGKVFINGEEIDASYTMTGNTGGYIEELIVTKDSFFCLGDNREVSVDSRYDEVGLVSEDDILGKAVFRLFPLKEAGRIENPYDG